MPKEPGGNPTPSDILAVGEKLEQFRQGLPPGEQAALAWLIQRAAMAPAEGGVAQGYAIVFGQKPATAEQTSAALPFQFETTWSLGESRP